MDPEDLHLVQRPELGEVMYYLNDTESLGVLLLGAPWSGKTTLLRMVEEVLKKQGHAVFFVSFVGLRYPGELGGQVLDAIAASPFKEADDDIGRTLRTSTGAPPLREAAAILRRAGVRLPSPVLLFDGLDESVDPPRMAAAVEELGLALHGWKLVVSSRPAAVAEIRRFARFEVVQLRNLTQEDVAALLREEAPGLSEAVIPRIADLAGGNPLLLQFMVREFGRSGSLAAITDVPSLGIALERLVNEAVRSSSNPAKLSELLEELALAGGRDRITALASKSRITEEEVRRLLDAPHVRALVVLDNLAETVALLHDAVTNIIVSRIFVRPFRLADLKFGAEEAERDELLDESFVPRRGMEAIFDMRRSIIVGDRGSGKSAIFRKLAGTSAVPHDRHVDICPVANPGDLLHRIVEKEAWLDADALRAAWIVVVASVVASAVPASAPKRLRRNAADLRAAFGLPTEQASLIRRALPAAFRLLGGTTLKFAVGPVNLEAQLPSGSGGRPGKASVDVESFLKEADNLLGESARRVIVMFDRIDEIFKYDRTKQEAVVQALLQAEGHVSLFECIGLVVFLRTDLFELYDIQEKNKLVSRTLTLDWSEEEWLQVLVKRVLVNEPFQRLAKRLYADDGTIETRSALEVLFPPEVEGQPVDQWLIDSLSNGNGDISPRLAVLLLYLTRELSARPEDIVSTLPLFTAETVGRAMTKLSDLSFAEIVNDFKVATSFVLNIRAGKLDSFDLHKVEKLFDEAEGKISEQVRLLERLGFLERVVQETGSGAKSLFRIPKLYTRCWDYA
jgi:NACHT domain